MRVLALLLLLFGMVPRAYAQPAETASVLVSTVMPRHGAVPETVTAYGTATPGPGTTITLSLPRAGQVQTWAPRVGCRCVPATSC